MHRPTLLACTTLVGLAGLVGFVRTPSRSTIGMTTGKAALQSASALALGPDGVIFVGDTRGAAVYALALGETTVSSPSASIDVPDVDAKIAALLGTTPREIVINDMVANPKARTVYLAVTRGRGPDAQPALIR